MNSFINKYYTILFVVFIAVIVTLSFYIGLEEGKSTKEVSPIVFSCPNDVLTAQKIPLTPQVLGADSMAISSMPEATNVVSTEKKGLYMGSKNGTKYYTPGCSGTKRIKPENYIWFQSIEDAILQGYSKGSC